MAYSNEPNYFFEGRYLFSKSLGEAKQVRQYILLSKDYKIHFNASSYHIPEVGKQTATGTTWYVKRDSL